MTSNEKNSYCCYIAVYFQAFGMVTAFDDSVKRQIIFVVVHKIGLKTISSD